eukprot:4747468-Pyramimonas_sp.AAC.1
MWSNSGRLARDVREALSRASPPSPKIRRPIHHVIAGPLENPSPKSSPHICFRINALRVATRFGGVIGRMRHESAGSKTLQTCALM